MGTTYANARAARAKLGGPWPRDRAAKGEERGKIVSLSRAKTREDRMFLLLRGIKAGERAIKAGVFLTLPGVSTAILSVSTAISKGRA